MSRRGSTPMSLLSRLALPGAANSKLVLSADEEELFAHDLGLMLRSGLRVPEALQAMADREGGTLRQSLPPLSQALQQGRPLSQAMADVGAFGTALTACVRASEATGDLGSSLDRFAQNARRLRELRVKLVSASVYPLVLVAVATLVVLFLLLYVVPRFATVLEGAGGDLPTLSRALIALGGAMQMVQWPLLLSLAAGVLLGSSWLWRASRERRLGAWLADVTARVPGLAPYVRAWGLAQLARSGGMLVRSGIPALKALRMCRELLPGQDRLRLDRALAAAGAGAPLAQSLHDSGLLDSLSFRVLKVSQQTGQLELALDRVADLHDDQIARALERISRLIEPLLMLGIGTVVGGIVVLMYLPIFQLAASIR
jgi:general secretion pathway protein F